MFGFSLFLLSATALLAVVAAVGVLFVVRGPSDRGCGCCSGCGLAAALLMAALLGAGIVLVAARRSGPRHHVRVHVHGDAAIERLERAVERAERRVERLLHR